MRFRDEYFVFSNFYPAPLVYLGTTWPTSEHLYQALKTLIPRERDSVRRCKTPGQAKRMGKNITLRPDWNDVVKLSVMIEVIGQKVIQVPEFRQALIDSGYTHIVEDNEWGDTFWGRCQGKGENHLGKIMMEFRGELLRDKMR